MTQGADETARSADGRTRLLDAAERLFDERGLDGTSARAIAKAAGHHNVAAVNYHFGNRYGLVRAVLTRRAEQVDVERHRLLDALEAGAPIHPRQALYALLDPMIGFLDNPGGRRYLRLLNHAANHPAFYAEAGIGFSNSAARAGVHVRELIEHLPAAQRAHRAQLVLGMVLYAVAEQSRLIDAESPPREPLDLQAFTEDLVAMTFAALAA